MRVNRQKLLQVLEEASVGLTGYEVLEQSNMFVFFEGKLRTFCDEIYFECESPLDFDAVVVAEDLVGLLTRFPDEEVDIELDEGQVQVTGKKRKAGLATAKEVLLPIKDVPGPGEWSKLKDGVRKHLQNAADTCGKDYSQILTTVVHVSENRVEGCDNTNLYCAKIETGFPKEVCVSAHAVATAVGFDLRKVSITPGWVHFKLVSGSRIALRSFEGEYHKDIDKVLDVKNGRQVELPSSISDMLDRAQVMNDTGHESRVRVNIGEGKIKIATRKDAGWYEEFKNVDFDGPEIEFEIHPKSLLEITSHSMTAIISPSRMRVGVGDVIFVVHLMMPRQETKPKAKSKKDDNVEVVEADIPF